MENHPATKRLHGGNLRIYGKSPEWLSHLSVALGGFKVLAEDAFGTQYCADEAGTMHIFDPEVAEFTSLDMPWAKFLNAIYDDPDGTIRQGLYLKAVTKFGEISNDQHYAFIIELALGGKETIRNLEIMESCDHMQALAVIAKQLKDVPVGHVFADVGSE